MRRLALISDHASPLAAAGGTDSGGQNIYVAQVARHLSRLGHRVDVYTRRDHPRQPRVQAWEDGVRVMHMPAGPARVIEKEALLPFMPAFAAAMAAQFRREGRPDLLHANFFMSGEVAMRLQDALHLPFAITFHALGLVRREHQGEADRFPAARIDIERRAAARAARVIAECPQDETDLLRLYGADARRIDVVPCGFDAAEFHPVPRELARARLGLSPTERIVLQLGRMVPRKGVDDAIRGVARLVHRHGIPARLLVVGGETETPDEHATPELARLRGVAAAEGITNRVTFTGRRGRDLLRLYYAAADVFVTTPWYEPFGITPLEAMACGTPVVGADVGGIRHSVAHGVTGWLVPPRDPDAIAQRLSQLFSQPEEAARMGRAAVARVNEHFTWEGVAKRLSTSFERALAGDASQRVRAPARPAGMMLQGGSRP